MLGGCRLFYDYLVKFPEFISETELFYQSKSEKVRWFDKTEKTVAV